MNLKNYLNYGMCIYQNTITGFDKYHLGDVVINNYNEIGVIIQVHSATEFRTDMFGNSSVDEVRMATDDEIKAHRPNIASEGHFTHGSKKPGRKLLTALLAVILFASCSPRMATFEAIVIKSETTGLNRFEITMVKQAGDTATIKCGLPKPKVGSRITVQPVKKTRKGTRAYIVRS